MRPTIEIAALVTQQGAHQLEEILRANGIDVEVEVEATLPDTGALHRFRSPPKFHAFVAKEDEKRARDALQGVFSSEWFLRTPDHRAYHSFEAATVDVLRHHVAGRQESDHEFELRDVAHLADLMETNGWHTVHQAFYDSHLFHHHPRPVEGRTLDEWARACDCAHCHTMHQPE